MPDQEQSTEPPPVDWTEYGVFRAAFLQRFDPGDRAALIHAGNILATQVLSGDGPREPAVVGEFRAAIHEARMLLDYLREIAETAVVAIIPSEEGRRLAREAEHWWRQASDLRHGMAAAFQDATGEWIEGERARE